MSEFLQAQISSRMPRAPAACRSRGKVSPRRSKREVLDGVLRQRAGPHDWLSVRSLRLAAQGEQSL
jgi:hypothetical protein